MSNKKKEVKKVNNESEVEFFTTEMGKEIFLFQPTISIRATTFCKPCSDTVKLNTNKRK